MKTPTKEDAKKVIKNTESFIGDNKKELLYAGAAIFLSYLGYNILSTVFKGAGSLLETKTETVKVVVRIDPSKTSITKEQAQQFAKTILDACNYKQPFWGTDEASINKVFSKLKTGDDFKMVYAAFGMKNYNGYNSPPSSALRHLDSYTPRDLVYWLKTELSPSDGEVYKKVKSRVESVGFSF